MRRSLSQEGLRLPFSIMKNWVSIPLAGVAIFGAAVPGRGAIYFSIEQAQQAIFPGATFSAAPRTLTPEQVKAVEAATGARVRVKDIKVWKVSTGGWFFVDEVLGKHEFITYAVGLTAHGAVKQIEIMDYRETYGGEVRGAKWRAQFTGKTARDPLKLDRDIQNISGATLSSRHITDGVKRLLAIHEVALR